MSSSSRRRSRKRRIKSYEDIKEGERNDDIHGVNYIYGRGRLMSGGGFFFLVWFIFTYTYVWRGGLELGTIYTGSGGIDGGKDGLYKNVAEKMYMRDVV